MHEPRNRTIRPECLQPYNLDWPTPTGDEVAELLRLAGFSGSVAANALGLRKNGARTVRKWIGNESEIPYAAWALLCNFAGLGEIWNGNVKPPLGSHLGESTSG